MTLQERQMAARKEADALLQERQHLNARAQEIHARLIGLDAELALMESLLAEEATKSKLKKKLKAVK